MTPTCTFLTDLCETKDFASQACTLVNLCCDAGFTIAYELGSVLNGTADLVPRLRLVQVHDQEGELRSRDIQGRHLFQQQDSDLLQRDPISLKYEDTLTKEKRGKEREKTGSPKNTKHEGEKKTEEILKMDRRVGRSNLFDHRAIRCEEKKCRATMFPARLPLSLSLSLSPIHHRCHYFLLLRRARKRRYGRLS